MEALDGPTFLQGPSDGRQNKFQPGRKGDWAPSPTDIPSKEGTDERNPCGRTSARRKAKRKTNHGMLYRLCQWVVEHQIGLSAAILALVTLVHTYIPEARPHTQKFFELRYYDEQTGYYRAGRDDFYLVSYWVVVFMGLRAAVMEYVLIPFAKWGGVSKKKECVRFAEQAWLFLYCTVFWSMGMYIYYNSTYWLNMRELWQGWPHRNIDGLLKWYYLVQFAFWLQQIVVVNIEERRKDYHQMFTHHIFTCVLIMGSYSYQHLRVGNLIMCLMDGVDILLSLAKMLKYLHFHVACDITFGIFMLTWFVARHVFYLMICWSIHAQVPHLMPYKCHDSITGAIVAPDPAKQHTVLDNILQPFLDPGGTVCFNNRIRLSFLATLLGLQVITIIWYVMILRVAWRVIKGGNADDSRSDDEGEEAEGEADVEDEDFEKADSLEDKAFLEEEVGAEEIGLFSHKGRDGGGGALPSTRRGMPLRKTHSHLHQASATGVTLPGHSDRKELLGRIGCDKTT